MKGFTKALLALSLILGSAGFLAIYSSPAFSTDYVANQTVTVQATVTCTGATATAGDKIQFTTSAQPGSSYIPDNQDDATKVPALNLTMDAGNNADADVTMEATTWADDGNTIPLSNELYDLTNSTGYATFTVDWETATQVPGSSTEVDSDVLATNKTMVWFNITIPAGQAAGEYNSTLTIACGVAS